MTNKLLDILRLRINLSRHSPWDIRRSKRKNTIPGSAIGFSYTDKDRMLLPGMLESFRFAEYIVGYYDNNPAADFQYNESERHKSIIRKARKLGAKYFWGIGPKRRLGVNAERIVRESIPYLEEGYCLFTNYKFLWGESLDRIRIDAFWDQRKTSAFFPIYPTNTYGIAPLHHSWHPKNLERHYIELNQYYIGRNTEDILRRKFEFYKSREYRGAFWETAVIEDLIPDKIESRELEEKVLGISKAEFRFAG